MRFRIDPRDVWPLIAIAVNTGEGQIGVTVFTAVLFGDDVIDLKGRRMKGGIQLAVFAAVSRPFADKSNCLRDHAVRYFAGCRNERLAWDCMTASRLLT